MANTHSTLRRLGSNEWQITLLIYSIFLLQLQKLCIINTAMIFLQVILHSAVHIYDFHIIIISIFILFVVFNTVRLVGWGNVTSQGRVEVFYKGSWGGVCGTNWDIKEANVVCRQLGFQGAVAAARSASDFSFMNSFQCYGNEASLLECNLTPKTWCWPNRAASVVCISGTYR